MDLTKEEINLCKQVAERHRKEIKCGDWIIKNDKLVLNLDGKLAWSEDGKQDIIITITNKVEVTPLWTISDCLEFLVKRNYRIESVWQWSDFEWEEGSIIGTTIRLEAFREIFKLKKTLEEHGNTLLEACLKTVLAVLEEVSNG